MFSIFAFFIVLSFSDGVVDEFNVATPDIESCEHFRGHVLEWAEASGATIEHVTDCEEITSA